MAGQQRMLQTATCCNRPRLRPLGQLVSMKVYNVILWPPCVVAAFIMCRCLYVVGWLARQGAACPAGVCSGGGLCGWLAGQAASPGGGAHEPQATAHQPPAAGAQGAGEVPWLCCRCCAGRLRCASCQLWQRKVQVRYCLLELRSKCHVGRLQPARHLLAAVA